MDRLKKFKKLWLTFLLGAIASCALALVAACGGGGEKVSLFLDAGEGGSLSETEYELEAGARLSDFLKDIDVTTQAGVTFDGWYRADSNVRVGEGDTMPESALTLKARYTVSYTVNFWVQNASGAFDRGDTATGTGFYLESCTPDVEVPQHYLVDGARSKTTVDRLNLNETFEIYLARRTYYVSYDANGLENAGSMPAGEGLYESSVPVSDCGFNVPEDHRFLGWSSSENGEIDYLPGDNIPSISSNLRLFAVWDVALRNRYSGSDLLFLPKLEEGKAILVRGGYDFEGEYDAEEGTFTVTVGGNVLEGKVFGNVYAYAERDLAGSYFYLDPYLPADFFSSPDPDERLDETIVLKIDEFGSAEYTHPAVEAVEAGTAQGYVRRTDGVYYFASDDGLFAFYFYLDTYTAADGVSRPVFCANSGYNESGTFYQFVTVDGGSGWEGSGMLELDGFGGLAYLDGDLRYYVGSYVPVQAYENAGNFIIKMEGVIYATDANEEPTGDAMRFPFYLTPLASGEYGFVIPNYLYGTFSNGEGETFVLDGFGSFPDSLTYTDGEGHTWQGAYTLYATSRYGTAIAAQLSSEGGVAQEFFFRFVFGSGANDVTIEAIRPEGAEYLELRDGGFYAPALVLLDEEYTDADNKTLGRKAELWLPESGGSVCISRGYYTEEETSSLLVATYVAVWQDAAKCAGIPTAEAETFTFLRSVVPDSSYLLRDVYYLLSIDGNSVFTVLDGGGDGTIYYRELSGVAFGSLYVTPEGNVFEGYLSVSDDAFGGISGSFVYYDPAVGTLSLYVKVQLDALGGYSAFTVLGGADVSLYPFENGEMLTQVTLLLRANGEAGYYTDDNAAGSYTVFHAGTYREAGVSSLGEIVYAFDSEGGVELFRFTTRDYIYQDIYETVPVTVWFRGSESGAKKYTAADGSTLETDGFGTAVYTDAAGGALYGIYSAAGGTTVYLVTDEGTTAFQTSGVLLTKLDGAYGVHYIETSMDGYDLTFSGTGTITIGGRPAGSYSETAERGEYEIVFTVNSIPFRFTVTFDSLGNCVILNDGAQGLFVGNDGSVLRLDGYDGGVYYGADGSAGKNVFVEFIDESEHFAMIRFTDYSEIYFNYDGEAHTFSTVEYLDDIYYAPDFKAVYFGAQFAYLNNNSGPYFVKGNKIYVYLMADGGYRKTKLDVPAGEEYRYNGETYYLWDGSRSVRVEGVIAIGEEGYEDLHATLSFTLGERPDPVFGSVTATLEVSGVGRFVMGFTNRYPDPDLLNTNREGAALYSENYDYYPIALDFRFGRADAENSFTAEGGAIKAVRTDYSDFANALVGGSGDISTLTESYIGFGPIKLTEPRLSGTLYYDFDATGSAAHALTFEDAAILTVAEDTNGARRMAIFTAEGKTYSVSYYEANEYYELYLIAEYSELASGEYTVGLNRYFYSNDAFEFSSDLTQGMLADAVLFETKNGVKAPVVLFNSGVNRYNDTAWMLPLSVIAEGDEAEQAGYLVELTAEGGTYTAATVTKYAFAQGMYSSALFANFFLDEGGEVEHVVALAISDQETGGYLFCEIEGVEFRGDGSIVVSCSDGYDYIITFLFNEDGSHQTYDDGTWILNVDAQTND